MTVGRTGAEMVRHSLKVVVELGRELWRGTTGTWEGGGETGDELRVTYAMG